MKPQLPLPLWTVTMLLALCAGVVLGSFAPVPRVASGAAADAPAETPVPFAAALVPEPAGNGERAASPEVHAAPADAPLDATGAPLPAWERVAQGPGAIGPGTDTLPAAPTVEVAVARPRDPANPPGAASTSANAAGGRPVIHIRASDEPPAARGADRPADALCPRGGAPDERGTVLCIRSPD